MEINHTYLRIIYFYEIYYSYIYTYLHANNDLDGFGEHSFYNKIIKYTFYDHIFILFFFRGRRKEKINILTEKGNYL